MKKQKWSPETIQDLNAAEMRLFKKEEKKNQGNKKYCRRKALYT